MAFNRQQKRIDLGDGRTRYRVLVTGDECPQGTQEARFHYNRFMHLLADNEHLLQCGTTIPERVTISHSGSCWQAEAEAIVKEDF